MTTIPIYSDFVKQSQPFTSVPSGMTFDANGWPIFAAAGQCYMQVLGFASNPVDPKGAYQTLSGYYTIFYDGAGSNVVAFYADNTTVTTISSVTGQATNNKIVINLVPDGTYYGPDLIVIIKAAAAGQPVTNVRVYDPSVMDSAFGVPVWNSAVTTTANIPEFHHSFIARISKFQIIRTCFAMAGNYSNLATFADYPTDTTRSYYSRDETKQLIPVTSIVDYSTDPTYFVIKNPPWFAALVTTSVPHGLTTGQNITFQATDTNPITLTLTGGSTSIAGFFLVYYDPAHMTTSQFAFSGYPSGLSGTQLVTAFTGSAVVNTTRVGSLPPSSMVRLFNQLPNTNLHITLPSCATQNLVNGLFSYIGSNLTFGTRKVILEGPNEASWNGGYGYPGWQQCLGEGQRLAHNTSTLPCQAYYTANKGTADGLGHGGTYGSSLDNTAVLGYAGITAQFHGWATTALGSHSSSMVRGYGTQFGFPYITWLMGEACTAINSIPDQYLCGVYIGMTPNSGVEGSTIGQVMSRLQAYVSPSLGLGPAETLLAQHVTESAYWFTAAKIGSYEGSINHASQSSITSTKALENQAAYAHPLYGSIFLNFLNRIAPYLASYVHLGFENPLVFAEGADPSPIYGIYQTPNQADGLNDGTATNGYNAITDIGATTVPPGLANVLLMNSNTAWAINQYLAGSSGTRYLVLGNYVLQVG